MSRQALVLVGLWCVGAIACQSFPSGRLAGSTESHAPEWGSVAPLSPAIVADLTRCASGECERACDERGDGPACALAAESFWSGTRNHPFDPALAFRYATRGCDQGDGLACVILGRSHVTGIGADWAPERAAALFEKACDAGVGLGCTRLASMLARGHGVDVDRAKAMRYFARSRALLAEACKTGEPRWCSYAGYLVAPNTPQRTLEALAVHQHGCDAGSADSCIDTLAARILLWKDNANATTGELDQLCQAGSAYACRTLSWVFSEDSLQEPRDLPRAAALEQRACDLGYLESCVHVAALYERGVGVRQDRAARLRHLRRACERGHALACRYLAEDATTISDHEADAARFAQRACQLGADGGCAMYVRALIAKHDDAAADRWAIEGCRLGSWVSCRRLVERDASLPRIRAGWARRLYQLGCSQGKRAACTQLARLEQDAAPVLEKLRDAIARQDAATFANLVQDGLLVRGLWFPSLACRNQFSGEGTVTAAVQSAFLECMGHLELRIDPQAGIDHKAALVFEPGIALSTEIEDGVVKQISAPERPPERRSWAPITPKTLESHLMAGAYSPRFDASVLEASPTSPDGITFAQLRVCVDERGKLDRVTVVRAGRSADRYVAVLVSSAKQWQLRPFEFRGKPVPVCMLDVFVQPPEQWQQTVASLSAYAQETDPHDVPADVLNAYRLSVAKPITPDEATRKAIGASNVEIKGSFRFCIDVFGAIDNVTWLSSTGFAAYDKQLETEIRSWRYRPIWVDGRVAAACSEATLSYR